MHFTWTLVLAIVAFSSHSQTFFLDDNGVTIKCVDCQPGDQGVVNGVTYTAVDNEMLFALKDPWISYYDSLPDPAVFETVCTTLVTDIDSLFYIPTMFAGNELWNPNISSWDVSNVTTMVGAFLGTSAHGTNPDLSFWDVGNVTNMDLLFCRSKFDSDISQWDVSSVQSMSRIFCIVGYGEWPFGYNFSEDGSCPSIYPDYYPDYDEHPGGYFDQDISGWDVSNVADFSFAFAGSRFNQDLSSWDVSSAEDMSFMFAGAAFNQPIDLWNVSNVVSFDRMFAGTPFNQDINAWDLTNAHDIGGMFCGCDINQDLSNWNVENVVDMASCFAHTDNFNGDISSWNTGAVQNMRKMFASSESFNSAINAWDVHNVTDMSYMFAGGSQAFNQDLNEWDVSSVDKMTGMFFQNEVFNGEVCAWDVHSVTDMTYMFAGCHWFNSNISNWDVGNVESMEEMFADCWTFNQPIGQWDVGNVESMQEMFIGATAFNQDLSCWCVIQQEDEPWFFLEGATSFEPSNWPQWGDCPDPSSCPDPIPCEISETEGCTDELACNYNPSASSDDGSCEYVDVYTIDGDVSPIAFESTPYTYPGNPTSTYNWGIAGGVIDGGQGTNAIDAIWANAGLQELSVAETTVDGCVGETVTLSVVVLTSGINDLDGKSMSVYPNPTSGNLIVNFGQGASQNNPVLVCTLDGRVLAQWSPAASITLDLSGWESGIYIVRCGAMAQRFVLSTRNQ